MDEMKQVALRIPADMYARWEAAANELGVSVAAYVKITINTPLNAALAKVKPAPAPKKAKPPSITHPNSVGPDGVERQEGMTYQEHVDDGWEDQWVGDIPDNWG